MASMLKFSEAASIGIHAMILLAAPPHRPLTCRRIADAFGASEDHTRKVMQRLVKTGLVRAVRGPGGGHRIAGDPARITLLQVLECLDGPLDPTPCLFRQTRCSPGACLLQGMLSEVDAVVRRHLAETTLADFAEDRERRPS